MKKEYDFSKGERGKYFKKGLELNIPIYLERDTYAFIRKVAEKKKSNVSKIVNDLIKTDIKIADYTS